uniref:Uncharacterized protein n=1 Tax=Sphaerodactylus townsendi TaxID=933632 RepID=A0ACB8FRX8_9SAUR
MINLEMVNPAPSNRLREGDFSSCKAVRNNRPHSPPFTKVCLQVEAALHLGEGRNQTLLVGKIYTPVCAFFIVPWTSTSAQSVPFGSEGEESLYGVPLPKPYYLLRSALLFQCFNHNMTSCGTQQLRGAC